mmetsp:Transcript_57415/g.94942  ORF Transcript_57415/g.94942 Transcript_57415/m.94942 type:complete len:173 (+) Transcript_57415:62-580(+)
MSLVTFQIGPNLIYRIQPRSRTVTLVHSQQTSIVWVSAGCGGGVSVSPIVVVAAIKPVAGLVVECVAICDTDIAGTMSACSDNFGDGGGAGCFAGCCRGRRRIIATVAAAIPAAAAATNALPTPDGRGDGGRNGSGECCEEGGGRVGGEQDGKGGGDDSEAGDGDSMSGGKV